MQGRTRARTQSSRLEQILRHRPSSEASDSTASVRSDKSLYRRSCFPRRIFAVRNNLSVCTTKLDKFYPSGFAFPKADMPAFEQVQPAKTPYVPPGETRWLSYTRRYSASKLDEENLTVCTGLNFPVTAYFYVQATRILVDFFYEKTVLSYSELRGGRSCLRNL